MPEQIQARGDILRSDIHKLINSICNEEDLSDQSRSPLLYQFTRNVTELTAVIIMGYHCYQLQNIIQYASDIYSYIHTKQMNCPRRV
jgi:hypothetical protein